ncbi:50S ribosomal protein L11 methyltransferase [Tichowtungia aerotolerans]|uniref:Methyltransferase n=1 Tax=Tichowtungia aerotolerans TaxID=2697043 RepID=A0A6P1MDJ8_9BACT|nr:50S ribosomal protein L11 methyltransferase [Tichowtungia aerotolerans]QHI69666.1 methyltransferase [Tichowtungia aerotolerans]
MSTEQAAGGAILTLATKQSHAEEISDWIAENLVKTVVELKKPGGKEVLLEVYFDNTLEAEVAAKALEEFPIFGKSIREYAAEEWTESWKKHFKPMDIGRNLRVCPPWLAGESDRMELVINPGLSFGTGNHFTTRFCLEQLDRLVPESGAKTMADIGTGSGILAIAAVKLGVDHAVGADFDPLCVEQSILNAAANGVAGRTEFFQHDITEGWKDETYDIVCANIYSSLLIDNASTLLGITGKYLLLTGIREVELDGVADTFVQLGGSEIIRDCGGEWGGLVFEA